MAQDALNPLVVFTVIVVLPYFFAVMVPEDDTVAICVSEEVQLNDV